MIDAHAHLEDEAFDDDRYDIIENLKEDGLDFVFNCGSSVETSRQSIELANGSDQIYAIVGIHPLYADEFSDENLKKIEELAQDKMAVAIGEIGLDNHYDDAPSKDIQMEAFLKQLELAEKLKMPVVIHSREAHKVTFDILKSAKEKNPDFVCLLHCYSGSVELMREYMKLGFYISLGGATTFKNARVPKEVAVEIPIDRLLLETDCPYMTPVPYRGKRCEPKHVIETAKNIANLRGISLEELVENTDRNTLRFYGLDKND